MPRLKYFNETTQQWEYAVVGAQGPVGPEGPQGEVGPAGADGIIGVDGEQGPAGIVAQTSAPTDTSIIWVDTDASAIDIPIGGTTGQALTKIDGTDFNTEWSDVYSQSETDTAISNAIAGLVDTAPTALNTLNELAAALGDDENFAATVTTALSGKSDTSHTHDDRYYTETETDTLLADKANTTHVHSTSDITSGILGISRGGTGVSVGPGLVPIIPSNVAVNSGTATVLANGAVVYSGVGTLDINGIFSSAYRNYRLVAEASTTANPSEWQYMQFRTDSGNNASATYESLYAEMNNAGGWNAREVQSATTSAKIWPTGNYFGNFSYDIYAPNIVLFTNIVGTTTYVNASSYTAGIMQIGSRENTSYTGIRIFGTGMSGIIKIYGYN